MFLIKYFVKDILKKKVVFITGASSGIGEYTAYALAKNGVKLVLAARRVNELERVKTQCIAVSQNQLTFKDILVLQMDVLKFDLHQKYFDEALNYFGQIDIVFNNAGRSQHATWENIDLNVDREMFDLNVFAVVNLSRIAVKYFSTRKEGHIAVTSSAVGRYGIPFSSSYNAAKHSLHGYFNSLRNEKLLGNLTVTLLCPGPIFTNYLPHCFTEKQGQEFGKTLLPSDKRMSAERCGQLCALSLANKLKESWMGVFPLLATMYPAVYTPTLYTFCLKIAGSISIKVKLYYETHDKKISEVSVLNV